MEEERLPHSQNETDSVRTMEEEVEHSAHFRNELDSMRN
jgi:hypothetical protein